MQNQPGCGGTSNSSHRASASNPRYQMSPLPALQNSPPLSVSSAPADDDPHRFHNHLRTLSPPPLASELRRNHINGAAAALTVHQQSFLSTEEMACGGDSGLLPSPLNHGGRSCDSWCDSRIVLERSWNGNSFQTQNPGAAGFIHALYDGLAAQTRQDFTDHQSAPYKPAPLHRLPVCYEYSGQSLRAQATAENQFSSNSMAGGAAAQTKPKVRARRGQATNPHSIAERLRRERITERIKALLELVPNARMTDKSSMVDQIIDYVNFIKLQLKILSMSRLGGPGLSSPGGGSEGGLGGWEYGIAATEQMLVRLLEDNTGSAMQYLQGRGLCLMPISFATAIPPDSHAAPPADSLH